MTPRLSISVPQTPKEYVWIGTSGQSYIVAQ